MELEPGLSARVALTVGEADTAQTLGSGDVPVLGTPRVLALCEAATVRATARYLPPGTTTVGTRVELEHLAATPVGGTVTAEARLVLHVPAAAFDPQPKVDSALVVMEVHPVPALDLEDARAFLAFVERVFQFRRKQLAGSLPRVTGLPAEEITARLQALDIDPHRRPQTLTLEEWGSVYQRIG